MMAAVLVRNLDDRFGLFGIQQGTVEEMQGTVLPLFIAMAILTLKLWELAVIAWPLMIILLVQARAQSCFRTSRSSLLGLKKGIRFGGILSRAPVFGLRPTRP